jgi:hypothetical protein
MTVRLLLLVMAVQAGAINADAATAVRILTRGSCTSGTVRAEPVCDGCAAEPGIARWTAQSGVADLPLDLGDAAPQWRVQAQADGCWSAAMFVAPQAESAILTILPAARLSFTLQTPRGEREPETVHLRVGSVREGDVPEALVDCERTSGRWHCRIPAAELDVRVSPSGFVPHYLWGIRPDPGATFNAGTLALRRGGSVAGHVDVSPRGDAGAVDVTLAPETYGDSPHDRRKALTTRTNARGFFQFRGVDAGKWTITAAKPGWSPARAAITVESGAEAALAKPLVVEPLATLELAIDPARDPGGADWTIRLEQMPEWGQRFRVAEKASTEGTWKADGLEAGMYIVTVRDAAGAVVHQGGQVVSYGMAPVPLRIDVIAVRGKVTLGGEPIAARLDFLQAGGRKARLQSDVDGTFAGHIPKEARFRWSVKVTPDGTTAAVQVRNVDVTPIDGTARVDIDLPDGRLSGTVVDETGQPVRSTLEIRGETISVDASTASDGTFAVRGLPLGEVELQATNKVGDSGYLKHTIRESDDEPLTIVTPRRLRVHATVVTPSGQPYAGALVRVLRSLRITVDETTGPNGRFPIQSPARDPIAHVVVLAPGYGAIMQALPLTGSNEDRRVVLPPASGSVWIPAGPDPAAWPFLAPVGLPMLDLYTWLEPPPAGFRRAVNGGRVLDLAPGTYRFCTDITERVCVTQTVAPGSRHVIEFPK